MLVCFINICVCVCVCVCVFHTTTYNRWPNHDNDSAVVLVRSNRVELVVVAVLVVC
jgi:hypothetical protein